jgi:RNA polymerase sigma-70 factor (ECF subfamily)
MSSLAGFRLISMLRGKLMSNQEHEAEPTGSNHPGRVPSNHIESKLSEATAAIQGTGSIGPADGLENIYREYRTRVFSTAYRFLRNREDAEDVTQDVFVKVFKKMGDFRGDAKLSTWIYRITVNTALDLLRKRKRRPTVSIDYVAEPSTGSSNLKTLIEGMIPSLPEGYRKVFVLHDIQGLKHAEIAEVLGITEGGSKSQLHRARAVMRKKLAPYLKDRHWR